MSKLLKLKKWLTLDEAANHISNVLGEPVTLADIYNFALDGHLVLSVNFVNIVKAKKVTFIKKEDIKYKRVRPKNLPNMPEGGHCNVPINAQQQISRDLWVESIDSQVVSLSGVWDLSMIGTEIFSIKQLYQQEISSNTEVKIPEAMSVYVKGAKESYELQLLLTMEQYREQHNTPLVNGMRSKILDCALAYPASRLDELDHELVVKVKEITRFIQSLEETPQEEKPLTSNERNSLLVLIAALCKTDKVDWNQRGIANYFVEITSLLGAPLSDDTIRKILNKIDPAVASRSK